MQTDNLFEMSNPISWENKRNIVNLSSAEFAQGVLTECGRASKNLYYKYRIRPNYRTVRLGFSNLDTLICGQICIYLLRLHYKKDQKRTYLMMTMRFFSDFLYKGICCGYSFELHRLVDAIQMSTHNICLCKEVKKKAHWL